MPLGERQPAASSWMAGRVATILAHLEEIAGQHAGTSGPDVGTLPLTYFDRTRWRRRPPTALTDGEAVTIGDRLRRRRLELGLSQVQLGKQLGVGRATVYRWERGECVPKGAWANGLDRFLKQAPTRSGRPPFDRGNESGSDSG